VPSTRRTVWIPGISWLCGADYSERVAKLPAGEVMAAGLRISHSASVMSDGYGDTPLLGQPAHVGLDVAYLLSVVCGSPSVRRPYDRSGDWIRHNRRPGVDAHR